MKQIPPIAAPLLEWYHQNRRVLPFREDPTPYHIWVSEIMLQQTRVSAALPYYSRFIEALPTPAALAAADEDTLHKLWQGLGYYSRVRNMHKAAKLVVENYGGALPASYEELRALPGIGDYTAGAIASIAFGLRAVAVDGNVLRVFARLYDDGSDVTLPATKKAFTAEVAAQQPGEAPGDYNQALMELGALVCTPGTPSCHACPLCGLCLGFASGRAGALPVKAPKRAKVGEAWTVILLQSGGKTLLRRRPAKGLLAGLWQPLMLEGHVGEEEAATALAQLVPGAALCGPLPGATHVFTHRVWHMQGYRAEAALGTSAPEGYVWASAGEIEADYSVPSAFKAYFTYF